VRACLKREAVRKGSRRVGQRRRLSLLKGGVMEKVGGALWRHAGKGREGGGEGRSAERRGARHRQGHERGKGDVRLAKEGDQCGVPDTWVTAAVVVRLSWAGPRAQ
jgi:hypothetical protein